MHDAHGTGHDQSIGSDSPQAVDGIAGTHAGTQEPAGAHVDAGQPSPLNPPADQSDAAEDGGVRAIRNTTAVGTGSVTVASHHRGFNGSVMRGGKAVSVFTGCGSIGRR